MTRPVYYPMVVATLSCVPKGGGQPVIFEKLPISADWELNSYRQADTFSVNLDARLHGELASDFDVEDWDSVSVEAHAFSRTNAQEKPADFDDGTVTAGIQFNGESLIVAGRMYRSSYKASDQGRTVTLIGSDYTTLLGSKKWDEKRKLPVGERLDIPVQRLIDEATNAATFGRRLTARVALAEGEIYYRGLGFPVLQAEGPLSRGLSYPAGTSYWDVISDICARCGKRVFVRGLDVVISTPQDIYAIADGKPMVQDDGTVDTVLPESRERRLRYGSNLTELSIDREGSTDLAQQIVRCYDPKTMKTLEGRWPPQRSNDDEGQVSLVHGVSDVSTLTEMARTRFHEKSRGEIVQVFETGNLTDLDGRSMLTLRAGDPLWVLRDDREVTRPLYCRRVEGKWSIQAGGGLRLRITAINYSGWKTADQTAPAVIDDGVSLSTPGTAVA